ncbi:MULTISPECIES: hypothetical protein [unclassified Paraburkholderia]|jgi:aromatic-amino-acid transaminase|uniref:hypothetical protein n=1 Tax=unclassified Paraburkholderia TaxID=2615204 RepID=UPI0038B75965
MFVVDAYPGDPILTLNENFQKDPRPNKVNLSIGIYSDNDGRLPVMHAVREAEAAMLNDPELQQPADAWGENHHQGADHA